MEISNVEIIQELNHRIGGLDVPIMANRCTGFYGMKIRDVDDLHHDN